MASLQILSISYTNKCNLHCTYCGRKNFVVEKEEIGIQQLLRAVDEAMELGLHTVNVTGGELFCREDSLDFLRQLIHRGLNVSIETNGTLLDDSLIHQLEELGDRFSLSISLDGIQEKTHDKTRGKGSYALAMASIRKISKSRLKGRVITVLSQYNYEEIPQLATEIYHTYGLGFRLLPNILEYGKGVKAHESEGVPFEKVSSLLHHFYYDFMKRDLENITVEMPIALMPLEIEEHASCPWGVAMLGIDYNGNVGLCHVGCSDETFLFGNLKYDSLRNIWETNEKLAEFRDFDVSELKGVCGMCAAKDFCRGGCRVYAISKFQDFYAPDPQCQSVYELGHFPEYALQE